jgi:hypothetical protein
MRYAMTHHCHARACTKSVPPEMLMCRGHWFRLPSKIRRAVWKTYRDGQCDDMSPSLEWHEAADAAIGFLAVLEDRPLRVAEMKALVLLGFTVAEKDGKLTVKEGRPS